MEPTIEQLRERYAAMENDELTELRANNQLTDIARSLIDEELRAHAIDPIAVETQLVAPGNPESGKVRTNTSVELSQASNPVEIFRVYWAGKGRLSGAYWKYGVVGSLAIQAASIIFGLLLLPAALRGHRSVLESGLFRAYIFMTCLVLIAYQIVVWILIWRNAANVENPMWGHLAKLAVIAGALLYARQAYLML